MLRQTMLRLKGKLREGAFLEEVMKRSGQNLLTCLQCGKCSGSCPITSEAVGGPRRLIAQILSGMQEEALRDPTWWYCVSCGSCACRCPVEINTYAVATTLCEMATELGVKPSEAHIHLFEELFIKSMQQNGRVQEIKTVMEFNLRTLKPWKDAVAGAKLMLKGALSPAALLAKTKQDERVLQIFKKIQDDR
jgi:heterodisulfide reductase subunit C